MRRPIVLLSLFASLACNPSQKETGGDGPSVYDQDEDGYSTDNDCDDTNANINPGATEVCDGADNDCDGFVDDEDPNVRDQPSWYADSDGDGWGANASGALQVCEAPSGWVSADLGEDCDDDDAQVNPGAQESCNEVDDDCDGEIDEDASDALTWHPDADTDGFGDQDSSTAACEQPEGHVADGSDCDDADPQVNPEAEESCNEADDDCDGAIDEEASDAPTWYADLDGDGHGDDDSSDIRCQALTGYVAQGGDCNDTDDSIHPGAEETCNQIDDDCDDEIDEEASDGGTWYADTDGDSYGDDATSLWSCDPPKGYVSTGGDCDDSDAEVNPAAIETCNDLDDDCDKTVDEEASDADTWYADNDADGWGDSALPLDACSEPSGYVAADYAGDCDDADANANPGADESCDGVDNDCDGDTDEDDAVDAATWYPDDDGDSYGRSLDAVTACYVPSGHVSLGGDCEDGDASINPGAAEICDGFDNDCDGTADEDDAEDAATWYPDADGDGFGDETAPTDACQAPSGYVAGADDGVEFDCDDSDAASNPDAEEFCDGLDNDCDGDVDEDPPETATTWYADVDGDGYGDSTDTLVACAQPSGYVADASGGTAFDCDDSDATINPAADELCDLADNDCDGNTDGTGYASFHSDASGLGSDVSGSLGAGTAGAPASYEITESGTLNLCPGTWYVELSVSGADVTIEGPYGYSSTILSGDGASLIIEAASGASSLLVSGLAMQDAAVSGADGGAIRSAVSGLALEVEACAFTDNQADNGGAIHVDDGDLTVSSSAFFGNSAVTDGGALVVIDGDLWVDSCYFYQNEADGGDGGAVFMDGALTMLDDSSFEENLATTGQGGALAQEGGTTDAENSSFTGNQAYQGGGALSLDSRARWTDDGCTWESNSADLDGGAIGMDGASFTSSSASFSGNTAEHGYGGAVYMTTSDAEFSLSSFTDNQTDDGGGAIWAEVSSDLVMVDSSCESNISDDVGGALGVEASTLELTDTILSDNLAAQSGGGIHLDTSSAELYETLLEANTVDAGDGTGGGAHIFRSSLLCEDSSAGSYGLEGNSASLGGAAYLEGTSSTLDSVSCDWGVDAASDDNDPDDIHTSCSASSHEYEDDASFSCSCAACK